MYFSSSISHSILQPIQSIELGYGSVSCHSHHGAEQGTQISFGLPWKWRNRRTHEYMFTIIIPLNQNLGETTDHMLWQVLRVLV